MRSTPNRGKRKDAFAGEQLMPSRKELLHAMQVFTRASLSLLRPGWMPERQRELDAAYLADKAIEISQNLRSCQENND